MALNWENNAKMSFSLRKSRKTFQSNIKLNADNRLHSVALLKYKLTDQKVLIHAFLPQKLNSQCYTASVALRG